MRCGSSVTQSKPDAFSYISWKHSIHHSHPCWSQRDTEKHKYSNNEKTPCWNSPYCQGPPSIATEYCETTKALWETAACCFLGQKAMTRVFCSPAFFCSTPERTELITLVHHCFVDSWQRGSLPCLSRTPFTLRNTHSYALLLASTSPSISPTQFAPLACVSRSLALSLAVSLSHSLSLLLCWWILRNTTPISYTSISLTDPILTINLKSENNLGGWLSILGKWLLGFKILCFIFAVGEYVGVQLAIGKLFLPTGKSWEKKTNKNIYSAIGNRRQAKKSLSLL